MPSSAWPGKEWTIDGFVEALLTLGRPIVLLGLEEDDASRALRAALAKRGIAFDDQVGRMSLRETGALLSRSHAYFGVDTGLAHLAEAVGTPAWVLMGPTSPLSGFGPWRPESLAIGMDLFCRPCGKDGTACIRPIRRHLCLKGLSAPAVLDQIGKAR
jgi:ADP-heptose:LPS heptosyltransferase